MSAFCISQMLCQALRKCCTSMSCCAKMVCVCREARKLLASIVTPPSVKSLDAILTDYVKLKEADGKRQQLVLANPLVDDILAAIERHQCRSASPYDHAQADAAAYCEHQPHHLADTSCCANQAVSRIDLQACQQPTTQPASCAGKQHVAATPVSQTAVAHVPTASGRRPSSSQHRKGAPQRRLAQTAKVSSPAIEVSVLPAGIKHRKKAEYRVVAHWSADMAQFPWLYAESAFADEPCMLCCWKSSEIWYGAGNVQGTPPTGWMNLPMTEDGFSSLMYNDEFQVQSLLCSSYALK